jgi:hypothetical protein
VTTRQVLVSASMATTHLRRAYGLRIADATIRQWAARGLIGRYGFGWYRYDLAEIEEVVQRRGLLDG